LQVSRRGIAPLFLAVIIVVIVAVAGVGAYVLLTSSPSSPTTSSTVTTSTTTSQATSSLATTSAATSSTTAPVSSSTTKSTTTSSASSTSQVTSTEAYTCTSTYTTGAPPPVTDYTAQEISLVKQYSSIQFKFDSLTNGTQSENATIGYNSAAIAGGLYNVTINLVSSSAPGGSVVASFIVDPTNSSVLSAVIAGQPLPQAYAKTEFNAIMGVFGLEFTYTSDLALYTSLSSYFHSAGSSSMTFGQVSFQVTTLAANSLPETFNDCGITTTLSAFSLQYGTPPGSSLTFITYLNFAGSSSDTKGTFGYTFQLVSMTVG
jgi:hypothetical protein